MDELIKYFNTAELPTEPIVINSFATVTDGRTFIDSCIRRYEAGDEEGFALLNAYRTALDTYDRQHTTE